MRQNPITSINGNETIQDLAEASAAYRQEAEGLDPRQAGTLMMVEELAQKPDSHGAKWSSAISLFDQNDFGSGAAIIREAHLADQGITVAYRQGLNPGEDLHAIKVMVRGHVELALENNGLGDSAIAKALVNQLMSKPQEELPLQEGQRGARAQEDDFARRVQRVEDFIPAAQARLAADQAVIDELVAK